MAIGRYPIPVPQEEDVANLFKLDPHGNEPRFEGRNGSQSMAIFELLEYIVNQVGVHFVRLEPVIPLSSSL